MNLCGLTCQGSTCSRPTGHSAACYDEATHVTFEDGWWADDRGNESCDAKPRVAGVRCVLRKGHIEAHDVGGFDTFIKAYRALANESLPAAGNVIERNKP